MAGLCLHAECGPQAEEPRVLSPEESLKVLGMTLGEYAQWRGKHVQAVRDDYKRLMRRGEGAELPGITRRTDDAGDGTVKFCLPLEGEYGGKVLETETVVIPMTSFGGKRWWTLCVSSQVGCRMACSFCETGRMGLIRNLTAGEIVRQRLVARAVRLEQMAASGETSPLEGKRGVGGDKYFVDGVQNIVFMGMGEPLDNFENVTQAIRVLSEPTGMNFPLAQITVSTVGRVDGLKRLSEIVKAEPVWGNLRIAISLNAARDELRDELMPVNKGMPLAMLKEALLAYPLLPKGRFLIEYVLIKGVNDGEADVRGVMDFCRGLPCVVNLIPYNPQRFAAYETPSEETVLWFMGQLKGEGLFVKRRVTHGRELMGACGQLGNPEVKREKVGKLRVLPS